MYLGFLDEADHTKRNQFTICGLTVVDASAAKALSADIRRVISQSEGFPAGSVLKSASASRPAGCTLEQHKIAKNNVFDVLVRDGLKFFGYAYFNSGKENNSSKNQIFGFNTLLGKFNDFLTKRDDVGVVYVDRIQGKVNDYQDIFSYFEEKFQKGNLYPSDDYRPLDRILSYGLTNYGSSQISAANDLLTGGLRYIINEENHEVRKLLLKKIIPCMAQTTDGRYREEGLTLRPKNMKYLPQSVRAEYQILKDFLNASYQ